MALAVQEPGQAAAAAAALDLAQGECHMQEADAELAAELTS